MAKLVFYDESHTYELDGEVVPSVSELSRFASREVYGDVSSYRMEHAARRGTAVHKLCEQLDLTKECDADAVSLPYIEAYVQFLREHNPRWVEVEKPYASKELKFAGTLDRVGFIGEELAIVDIKTSSSVKKQLAQIQLPAYKYLYEENNKDTYINALYILHLKPTGKYKLMKFDMDDSLFRSCLTLHNAFVTKKKKKEGKKK